MKALNYSPEHLTSNRRLFWIAALLGLIMMAPVAWIIGLSLKDNAELLKGTEAVFSFPYTMENYANILKSSSVFGWFMNSMIVAVGQTFGVLLLSSLAGYAFARLEFPFRKTIFIIVLFGLAVPEQAVIIARHQMFNWFDLHNTHIGLILPNLSSAFGVFLMTQFFRAIPKEIDEAAMLDNTSTFRIFWKVLLPLTLPAQATLGIFTFLQAWNDYWWPLISATKSDMYTLTIGIASSQTNFAQSEGLGFLGAQAIFASLPVVLVYIFFQRHIVTAVSGGAVK
ncbi:MULTISPECIES: carbohydrate ABC transporter permease [Marinomonas]|jgi:multiple sugar transport system permease protein|uniref:sn-glycerol-3-phosphate transport system permease protein UgpE n=1 Tax=Marinomonas foliarum TaxID=491950 RepID=A0A369ADK4_9GAMM|nr:MULTISPECIES: carbohydrate ABC transporter permease [Marinomonas]QRV23664.1 carbohydrate ABC transporter permease [Marinomonas foliarum]RCX07261.1 carbohydrate ABC transporter membrane protein 2 (CUT1 family) [Marinomonas foliarum]UTV98081.1 carbohydrate ABC transporter permease [Marinomonas rhizomae]